MSEANVDQASPSRRFGPMTVDQMDLVQRQINDSLIEYLHPAKAGSGATIGGPMDALLHSPQVADVIGRMVTVMFEDLSLPRTAAEVVILVTARYWNSDYEFHTHRRYANRYGLDVAVIDALERGERPEFDDDLGDAYDFALQLLQSGDVSDRVFERVASRWTLRGAVEIVATVGFYTLLGLVMNIDRCPVPPEAGGWRLPIIDRPTAVKKGGE